MTREEFCLEAKGWIRTPYVLGGRVKGAGADCASFIAECLVTCGLAEREELGVYSHDWFCNTQTERYMFQLLRHARQTLDAIACGTMQFDAGSVVLTRVVGSRVYNHGGIYIGNNQIIHAVQPEIEQADITKHHMWTYQEISVFDPFAKREVAQ